MRWTFRPLRCPCTQVHSEHMKAAVWMHKTSMSLRTLHVHLLGRLARSHHGFRPKSARHAAGVFQCVAISWVVVLPVVPAIVANRWRGSQSSSTSKARPGATSGAAGKHVCARAPLDVRAIFECLCLGRLLGVVVGLSRGLKPTVGTHEAAVARSEGRVLRAADHHGGELHVGWRQPAAGGHRSSGWEAEGHHARLRPLGRAWPRLPGVETQRFWPSPARPTPAG